jgi:hypothetical protein
MPQFYDKEKGRKGPHFLSLVIDNTKPGLPVPVPAQETSPVSPLAAEEGLPGPTLPETPSAPVAAPEGVSEPVAPEAPVEAPTEPVQEPVTAPEAPAEEIVEAPAADVVADPAE